ncbi:MAG: hypothetical protein E6G81_12700 [Alphaproteobacteria bacterium]|nr:MAG: hypothetical protein E6G81_12700 [Alphaproteobacteria bacterium]
MPVSLLVDGLPSLPETLQDGRLLFHVALPAREIRILSGFGRPVDFGHPVDRRRLGVALLGVSWERGGATIDTPVDSSAFIDGFQHVEQPATSDRMFRWTDGNAALPPSLFPPWRGETRLYLSLKEWDGSSAATPLGPEAAALSRFDGNAALPPSLFPPWRGATRLYLNLKEWDGSFAAMPLGPQAAALSAFDSLGENCELALAQRHYGVELPLSLLRWSGTTYEDVARGLECRFEGLGDPATTRVAWTEMDYRIQTPYLRLHTTVIEPRDEKGVAELLHHGCATLRLLRRKLLRDIADSRRIFVFKSANPGFGLAEMRRLQAAMRAIGPASLLCVTRNDRAEACRVEKLADRLYAGRLERFVIPHGPFDEWAALCSETLKLHRAS